METRKQVIQIIKKASNQSEYDEYYYFTNVAINDAGKTIIQVTGDIWKAVRFDNMSSKEIQTWCTFIKNILGKRNHVSIKTIILNYEL